MKSITRICIAAAIALPVCVSVLGTSARGDDALREQAKAAMRKAADFYRGKVAVHGGYVYYYSLDLQQRLGEGAATAEQIWVQPPGTPTVGLAYLKAWQATGEQFYLDAATETAEALLYGQLQSGGWTNSIDFNPRGNVALYRSGKGGGRNYSTLDDGISQGAIRLLMHVDRAHAFKHERIHEAALFALDALLAAQFPSGAFPQVWTGPAAAQGVVKATFPDYDWRTENRIKEYWNMYTLNDGLAGTVLAVLEDAHQIYQDDKYKQAITKLGDFLLLAQLPEPQPAWSQQYDYQMRPIWARKFEPAAVTGGESQDVLETLLAIYRITGEKKYLEPIPAALAYLKKSLLADGRLARYYELESNKPLYMFRRGDVYTLTYDDSRLPEHYGWKVDSRLEAIERAYAAASKGETAAPAPTAAELETQARAIVAGLDDQGRWITTYSDQRLVGQPKFRAGDRYIGSAEFSRNLETLSEYLLAP
jgi:PelA/Pel-15E family pectate lyase